MKLLDDTKELFVHDASQAKIRPRLSFIEISEQPLQPAATCALAVLGIMHQRDVNFEIATLPRAARNAT
jgi:hypothetical protein